MSKKFFVVCFPYYVRYHLVFFLVNIFFINFDNKLFFSAHIFNKLFFLTFVATNFFLNFNLAPPPPPDIKWCVPNPGCGARGCLTGVPHLIGGGPVAEGVAGHVQRVLRLADWGLLMFLFLDVLLCQPLYCLLDADVVVDVASVLAQCFLSVCY